MLPVQAAAPEDGLLHLLNGYREILGRAQGAGAIGPAREIADIVEHVASLASPKSSWNQAGTGYESHEAEHRAAFRDHVLQTVATALFRKVGPITKTEINGAINEAIKSFPCEGTDNQYRSIATNMRVYLNGLFQEHPSHISLAYVAAQKSIPPDHAAALLESRNLSSMSDQYPTALNEFNSWLDQQRESGEITSFHPTHSSKALLVKRLSDVQQTGILVELEATLELLHEASAEEIQFLGDELNDLTDRLRTIAHPTALPQWYVERVGHRNAPSFDEPFISQNISREEALGRMFQRIAYGTDLEGSTNLRKTLDTLTTDNGLRFFQTVQDFTIDICRDYNYTGEDRGFIQRTCNQFITDVRDFINERTGTRLTHAQLVPYIVFIARAHTVTDYCMVDDVKALTAYLQLPNDDLLCDIIKKFAPHHAQTPNGMNEGTGVRFQILKDGSPLTEPTYETLDTILTLRPRIRAGKIFACGTAHEILSMMLPGDAHLVGSRDPSTPMTSILNSNESPEGEYSLVVVDVGERPFNAASASKFLSLPRVKDGVSATVFVGEAKLLDREIDYMKKTFGIGLVGSQITTRAEFEAEVMILIDFIVGHYGSKRLTGQLKGDYSKVAEYAFMFKRDEAKGLGAPGTIEMFGGILKELSSLTQMAIADGLFEDTDRRRRVEFILRTVKNLLKEFNNLKQNSQSLNGQKIGLAPIGNIIQSLTVPRLPYHDLIGNRTTLWTGYEARAYGYPELMDLYVMAHRKIAMRLKHYLKAVPEIAAFVSESGNIAERHMAGNDSQRYPLLKPWDLMLYFEHLSKHGVHSITHWSTDIFHAHASGISRDEQDEKGVFYCFAHNRPFGHSSEDVTLQEIMETLHQINLMSLQYGGANLVDVDGAIKRPFVDIWINREAINLTTNFIGAPRKTFSVGTADFVTALRRVDSLKMEAGLAKIAEDRLNAVTVLH